MKTMMAMKIMRTMVIMMIVGIISIMSIVSGHVDYHHNQDKDGDHHDRDNDDQLDIMILIRTTMVTLMLWIMYTIDIFSHCRFLASPQGKNQVGGFQDEFI